MSALKRGYLTLNNGLNKRDTEDMNFLHPSQQGSFHPHLRVQLESKGDNEQYLSSTSQRVTSDPMYKPGHKNQKDSKLGRVLRGKEQSERFLERVGPGKEVVEGSWSLGREGQRGYIPIQTRSPGAEWWCWGERGTRVAKLGGLWLRRAVNAAWGAQNSVLQVMASH